MQVLGETQLISSLVVHAMSVLCACFSKEIAPLVINGHQLLRHSMDCSTIVGWTLCVSPQSSALVGGRLFSLMR
jgi:hypothetical protein